MGVRSTPPLPLLLVLGPLALLVSACELTFGHPSHATASLRMHGTPQDATVTIDEELVGTLAIVATRGVALPEGTHQVTVAAPGYFPWDKLVKSEPGTVKRIDLAVDLLPVPE